jgi:hypothetical protein
VWFVNRWIGDSVKWSNDKKLLAVRNYTVLSRGLLGCDAV